MVTAPALAQQVGGDTGASDDMETVVVTGTRIQRPNLTSNSPITVIDSEYLENRGLGRIEDAISTFPQVHPMLGMKASGETAGPHEINLRRLGVGRTLTLVDGMRTFNDVNNIPGSLVQRIDILTGGASAVYGSDAIGGVVNFILKKNFNGVVLDAEISAQQHENDNQFMRDLLSKRGYPQPQRNFLGGEQVYFNITAGTDFANGRGNISGFVGYKETEPMMWKDIDHAGCRLNMNQQAGYGGFTPPTQLKNDTFDCNFTEYRPYGRFNIGPNSYQLAADGSKTWVAYNPNDVVRAPVEDYLQNADQVYRGGLFVNYTFSERLKVDLSVLYTENIRRGQTRRFHADNVTTQVRCDNSLMSTQQRGLVCGVDNPNRILDDNGNVVSGQVNSIVWRPEAVQDFAYGSTVLRTQINFNGRFSNAFNYNVGYAKYTQDAFNRSNHILLNNFQNRVSEGIAGVGASGSCAPVAPNTQCVAANIYSFDGKGLGDASYDYVTESGENNVVRENQVLLAVVNGELGEFGWKSPWANDPIAYAVSAEYRKDTVTTGGNGGYSWFVKYVGEQDVSELALEVDIPLIQDKPLIRDLTFNGGYRLSDYSTHGEIVKTWKAELSWQPSDHIRFRTSINEAFRVAEKERLEGMNRYTSGQFFLDLCAPPAAGSVFTRYTYEQCSINMSQAQYDALTTDTGYNCNTSGFCQVGALINGGRVDLKPETARSYTVGVVFRPKFWPDFTATADWYSIDITNAFEWVRADQIFTQCYDNKVQTYCDQYKRDPNTGRVAEVDARWVNAGFMKTQGVDITANYRLRLTDGINGVNVGSFNFSLNGTLTQMNERKYVAGAPTISCVGYFGPTCGDPWAKWRHTATVNWLTPWRDASVGLNWRYVGKTMNDRLSTDLALSAKPNAGNTNFFPLAQYMPSASYFDLFVRVPVTKQVEMRFNVQNLLDTEPPLLGEPIGNTFNTYPSFYDAMGRTLRLGVTAKF